MKNRIVYIDNNSLDVYFNFALEYYLTTEKTFEDSTVLLFWRTSPTLMVGKYQNTLEEIDQDYAAKKNISIVRRMSGGGTIYTDLGGWQYSFITKGGEKEIQFKTYIKPVVEALKTLEIEAEFNGRNDLVIDGRKFSGTAQYMHNGFMVHHGSLLYATDIDELAKSANVPDHKIKSKGIKSVHDRVTNISNYLSKSIGVQEFKKLMVKYLMGDNGVVYTLTSEDIERIWEIAKDKFDNWDTIYGKNPKCDIVKRGHFKGGSVETRLNVRKGRIEGIGIFGDFFGTIDKEMLENALKGCLYRKDEVRSVLNKMDVSSSVHDISEDEILSIIV